MWVRLSRLIITYFDSAVFFPHQDMMITTTLCTIICLLVGHWAMLHHDPWKFLFISPYAFPNVLIYLQRFIFLFAPHNFFFVCSPAYFSSPIFPKIFLVKHGSGTKSKYLFQHQVYSCLNVGSSLPPHEPVFASEWCCLVPQVCCRCVSNELLHGGSPSKSVTPDCHLLEYTSTAQQEPRFQEKDYKSWQALDPGLGFVRIQIFCIHNEPTATPCCPQWHVCSFISAHKREYKTL